MLKADVSLRTQIVVDRILERARENAREGRPMREGADPYRTLAELGVEPDPARARSEPRS